MLNYQSTSYHDALAAQNSFSTCAPLPNFWSGSETTGIFRDTEPARPMLPRGASLCRVCESSLAEIV